MDKVLDYWYSDNKKKTKEYEKLIMLGLDEDNLKEFSKDKEMVKKYMIDLTELNCDPRFQEYMTKEEDDRKKHNTEMKYAKEEGAKQEKIEIAKSLLNYGMSIEDIAKNTQLSIEEIKKIKKET